MAPTAPGWIPTQCATIYGDTLGYQNYLSFMEALNHLVSSPILIVHIIAALFALAIGPFNLVRRKRDRTHRMLGRTWVIAMVITAVTSFGVQQPFSALSGLHALSAWTLISLTLGVVAIRRGNVKAHQGNMVGSYLGLWAAFLFAALVPTRTLSQVTAAAPLTAITTVVVILLAVAATWLVFRPARVQLPLINRDDSTFHASNPQRESLRHNP